MVKEPFTVAVDEFAFNRVYRAGMEGRFGEGILGTHSTTETIHFLLMMQDDRVVAAQKYYADNDSPDQMYLAFLETARDSKGKGYGARLFSAVFDHAVKVGRPNVTISQYTDLGEKHLLSQQDDIVRRHAGRVSIIHEPGV